MLLNIHSVVNEHFKGRHGIYGMNACHIEYVLVGKRVKWARHYQGCTNLRFAIHICLCM